MATVHDREWYTIHYRNLEKYNNMGLRLKKIHRALEFTESCWIRDYIDFNIKERAMATTEFEKEFYKLLNNRVIVKTMENVGKRVEVSLVTTDKLNKLVSKPSYVGHKTVNENLYPEG